MELTPRALVLRALGVKVLTLLPVPDSVIADELELSLCKIAMLSRFFAVCSLTNASLMQGIRRCLPTTLRARG